MTKKCGRCRKVLSVESFASNKSRPDGRAQHCTPCKAAYQAAWYQKNKESHYRKTRIHHKRYLSDRKAFLDQIKAESGCVDCGIKNPIVLDFDHIGGTKSYNISRGRAMGLSKASLLIEIRKCQVRCANCHRIVTHERRVGN